MSNEKIDFFTNILKFIKSNAIAVFDNTSLISQSGGQTSRIDALENCLYKLNLKQEKKKKDKLYLFSDAFFPFTDSLEFIKNDKSQIDIYAPMGSKNDILIRKFVRENKLNFFQLNDRHFKH